MSQISLERFGENLPVSGVVALSQVAIGIGVGLLLSERIPRRARRTVAVTLLGAGVAAFVPVIWAVAANLSNHPSSSRRMRKKLESIRYDSGFADGNDAY